MKPEDIIDAMNNIDDKALNEAEQIRKPSKKKGRVWVKWVAVAACFCIVIGAVLGHFHFNPSKVTDPTTQPSTLIQNIPPVKNPFAISNAVYPDMLKVPSEKDFTDENGNVDWVAYSEAFSTWSRECNARRNNSVSAENYSHFFNTTTKKFFADTKGENLVYSPVNVYLALCMLAESTGGQSRQQILDLLGANSIEELRNNANKLWMSNYSDDGIKTNILANSVWMSDSLKYNKSTLDILANNYYASSFSGAMGSQDYSRALQNWLNEQTGGLLKEQADAIELSPDTILSLASTVYFNGRWENEFPKHVTKPETFHAVKGPQTIDFMYQRLNSTPFYTDDNYSATYLNFKNGGKMWLILPDAGNSPESLIQNGSINSILNGSTPKNKQNNVLINVFMPKFDVVSSTTLNEYIEALGVKDVFYSTKADFSPILAESRPAYVSEINHSARVTVDEEGCTAAAFTVISAEGAMIPEGQEIYFRLDRPFLFVITSDDSTPLFVGVVNNVE